MMFFLKYFFVLSSIIMLSVGHCSAEIKGLSEKQLKGFVGEEKVCFERVTSGCGKSKEMMLAIGVNKIDINELNDISQGVSSSEFREVALPPAGYSYQNTQVPLAPKLVEIGDTQTATQKIEFELPPINISAYTQPIELQGQEFIRVSKPDTISSGFNNALGVVEVAPHQ